MHLKSIPLYKLVYVPFFLGLYRLLVRVATLLYHLKGSRLVVQQWNRLKALSTGKWTELLEKFKWRQMRHRFYNKTLFPALLSFLWKKRIAYFSVKLKREIWQCFNGPQQKRLLVVNLLTVWRQKWTKINLIFWFMVEDKSDILLFMFLLSNEYA